MDTTAIIKDTIVSQVKLSVNNNTILTSEICCKPWWILLIILITGIIGGSINYLLNNVTSKNADNLEKTILKDDFFYLQILLGICGAALIPLLLYLTSSKLFESCDSCHYTYFVFTGYCLVGSIFSKSLLNSLAKRLDIEELKEKLKEEVKSEIDKKIIETKLEEEELEGTHELGNVYENPEPLKEEIAKSKDITQTDIDDYIKNKATTEMESILNDLQTSKYKDRSIRGISKKTKIHENNVSVIINAFKKAGIVTSVQWYGKTFYTLTEKGKQIKLIE